MNIPTSITPFLNAQSKALQETSPSNFGKLFKGAKNSLKTLAAWADRKDHQLLVHSVRYEKGPLFEQKADDVFAKWDVMSTSLINVKNISNFGKVAAWEDASRRTGAFDTVSFVLDVAPQNIIGAHSKDVFFPNHAGVKNGNVVDRHALADAIFTGKKKNKTHLKGGFNQLMSPKKLLEKSTGHHNETLVVAKKNINTYPHMKPTQAITVRKILVARQAKFGGGVFERAADADTKKIVTKLEELNPGILVEVIK